MPRIFGFTLVAAVAVAWIHLFGSYTAWATPVHWTVAGASIAIALVAAWATWRGAGSVLVGIAALLLGLHVAIIATTLAGVKLIPFDLFPDARLAVVVGACCALGVYGLVRRRIWGRWLALALGATGAVTGGLNAAYFWKVTSAVDPMHVEWSNAMYGSAWVMLTCALGGLAIVVCLVSPAARDLCARDGAWTSDARLARMVRPMLVTSFAAAPMLLVYAWLQPIVPETRVTAIILTIALAAGAVVTVRGKLVGAFVLVLAGLGLLVQSAVTLAHAPDAQRGIAGYYLVFWLPAAVCAIVCGVRLAGPTWRLLRGR